MFEQQNLDGVLLGHPRARETPRLQPDVLLVLPHCVVVIDFKNISEDATVYLPRDSGEFRRGRWMATDRSGKSFEVKGGKSVNPCQQLHRQSSLVKDILVDRVGVEVPVYGCVLFHGGAQIVGKVPGQLQRYFWIANSDDYLNVLHDLINTRGLEAALDLDAVLPFFEVSELRDLSPLSAMSLQKAREVGEVSQEASKQATGLVDLQTRVTELEEKIRAGTGVSELRDLAAELESLRETERLASERVARLTQKLETERMQLALEIERERTKQRELEVAAESARLRANAAVTVPSGVSRPLIVGAGLLAVSALIATAVWAISNSSNSESQTLSDQRAGSECVEAAEMASFVTANEADGVESLENVCVSFFATNVYSNGEQVFIEEAEGEGFKIYIPSSEYITEETARTEYLDRTLEVRGEFSVYEGDGRPQVEVRDTAQIDVID
ncbi:nuclease-related domain-containing protein [Microcella frigidaquae]|nr:nuclease-related domain-containing protein [Microcella frigidaquae]